MPTKVLFFALLITASGCAQVLVDTVAGGGNDDGVLAVQSHTSVAASAFGPDGSIYFSSLYSIRRIKPDGTLETIAGTGVSGFSGDGGPAAAARLRFPALLFRDPAGNLLFTNGGRIRRISPDGIIDTIAGNGLPVVAGIVDGPALGTPLDLVSPLAIDPKGNIYAISSIGRVVKVTPGGTAVLFAGSSGTSTVTMDDGDGGPAVSAHLWLPSALAADSSGNIFVAESFGKVRKIDSQGIISTIAGLAPAGRGPVVDAQSAVDSYFAGFDSMVIDPAGNLYLGGTDYLGKFAAYRIDTEGKVFNLPEITGTITGIDSASTVYFVRGPLAYSWKAGQTARVIAGQRTYAAPNGANAARASIDPAAVAVDTADRVVFSENGTCLIRRIAGDGTLETIAGTGKCVFAASGGPARSTDLTLVTGIATAPDGTLYLASSFSTAIYRLSTAGQISVVTLPVQGNGIVADAKGNIFTLSNQAVFKVTPDGQSSVFATMFGPGAPFAAIDIDPSGLLHIYSQTSTFAYTINPTGQVDRFTAPPSTFALFDRLGHEYRISTFAQLFRDTSSIGNVYGLSGDGGPVQSAYFYNSSQLAVDSKGAVYVLDKGNSRIRKLTGSLPEMAPSIAANSVVSSATYDGAVLAGGEIVSVYGKNLAYGIALAQPENNSFPLHLGSTSVLVDNQAAPLLFATPGQVNFVLFQNHGTSVKVQVDVDGVSSAAVTVPIGNAHPGLYTADASGSGPASIVNQDGTVNSALNPAPRGSVVSLYGTGAGAMTQATSDGYLNLSPPFGTIAGTVSARIDGQNAEVLYSGGAPFLITGEFQINVRIPSGIQPGKTPLAVVIASVPSNNVTVWTR